MEKYRMKTASPEGNFSSLLADILPDKAILAISTYRSGRILFARVDSGNEIKWLVLKREIPSGIAFDDRSLSIATIDEIETYSHEDIHYHFNTSKAKSGTELFTYFDTIPIKSYKTGKILCHEIYSSCPESIYFISTRYSAIGRLYREHITPCFWKPPFITEFIGEDLCHMNGLGVSNGQPEVISCLAGTNFTRGWRLFPANSGLLINIKTNKIICSGLTLPHSPRMVGESIYFLQSGLSCLSVLDTNTCDLQSITELPGFARGLAIIGKYAIIGISVIRNSNLWESLPVKVKYPTSIQSIVIVDLVKGVIISTFVLPGEFYEIFDIQIIKT